MKYFFYVHSYITYIVSISVILLEDYPIKDVIFIFTRNFESDDDYMHILNQWRLDSQEQSLTKLSSEGERFLLLTKYFLLKKIDRKIYSFSKGDNFIFFTPTKFPYLINFIATNKRCIQINYIEEGIQSYNNRFYRIEKADLSIKNYVKFINHGNRSLRFNKRIFRSVPFLFLITLVNSLFDPSVQVVRIKKPYIPKIDSQYHLNNCDIFFLDVSVEKNVLNFDAFQITVHQFLLWYETQHQKIWIKFHPTQSIAVMSWFIETLTNLRIQYEILRNNICSEALLLYSRNLRVFGFHSSLLFYASYWGHKAFSLDNIASNIDARFAAFCNNKLPECFLKLVSPVILLSEENING